MTRRDYVLIAAALREARGLVHHASNTPAFLLGCDSTALTLGRILAERNPCFDSVRFLRDSGVPRGQHAMTDSIDIPQGNTA